MVVLSLLVGVLVVSEDRLDEPKVYLWVSLASLARVSDAMD